jgi:transcriptional regulator with XRE-family HTH domain
MNNTRDEIALQKFGENLRKIRKAKKLTMQQLAFAADIELSQVHRIEKGKTNPTVTTVLLLADALGISPTKMFDF